MKRAQKRDAVLNKKFLFRNKLATCNTPPEARQNCPAKDPSFETVEMTINEIVNGQFFDPIKGEISQKISEK